MRPASDRQYNTRSLTEDQVADLFRMRAAGKSYAALEAHFQVSGSTIHKILTGQWYRWCHPEIPRYQARRKSRLNRTSFLVKCPSRRHALAVAS